MMIVRCKKGLLNTVAIEIAGLFLRASSKLKGRRWAQTSKYIYFMHAQLCSILITATILSLLRGQRDRLSDCPLEGVIIIIEVILPSDDLLLEFFMLIFCLCGVPLCLPSAESGRGCGPTTKGRGSCCFCLRLNDDDDALTIVQIVDEGRDAKKPVGLV